MTRYRVVSPYVTLRIPDPVSGKWTLVGFHVNAILPADVYAEDVERHLRKGMVELVDEPAPPVVEDPLVVQEPPAGEPDPPPAPPAAKRATKAAAAAAAETGD